MLRFLATALFVFLGATAHAQTADLEAKFTAWAAQTEAEGAFLVADPVVEMYKGAGVPMTHGVDLEAGVEYYLFLFCDEGSGLDPDIRVHSPGGAMIASGREESEGEVVVFEAEASGTYALEVVVRGCDGECAYGFVLVHE